MIRLMIVSSTTIAAAFLLFSVVRLSWAATSSQSNRKPKDHSQASGKHGPGFYNHSGCLYVHIGDQGHFEMTTADEFKVNETLDLDMLDFDETKSRCASESQAGKLTFSYKLLKNKRIGSIVVAMRVIPVDRGRYWEVSQANLTVTRADIERRRTFPLKLWNIYAASEYSYSCSKLVVTTLTRRQKTDNETKVEPYASITLPRFQLQPFAERRNYVFAPSYDCSSWLTIPAIMGLILILFMTVVTVLGVSLLKGIVTNDFKFNKEGLQFTQAQMETNKQR